MELISFATASSWKRGSACHHRLWVGRGCSYLHNVFMCEENTCEGRKFSNRNKLLRLFPEGVAVEIRGGGLRVDKGWRAQGR